MNRSAFNWLLGGLLIVTIAIASLGLGPLLAVTPKTYSFILPQDLDAYLAESERQAGNVKRNQEKRVFWADTERKAKTPLALVYLHGFSASRGEISPVVEDVARELGANLFMTRLKGHGLADSAEAMANLTAHDLIADAEEAMAIGKKIGERVVLVGVSTGAALAFHLAARHPETRAIVSLSANFAVKDSRAKYLSGPLGRPLARALIGEYYEFETKSDEHREYWTSRYRSESVVAMFDLLNYVGRLALDRLQMPVLTLYTERDEVIDIGALKAQAARIKSTGSRVVDGTKTYKEHVIAGRIISPEGTEPLKTEILGFLRETESIKP